MTPVFTLFIKTDLATGKSMEISKEGSLDKTLVDLLKLTLTLVNLWKFPKTDVDKTLLDLLKLTLTLVNLWKFPKTDLDKTLLRLTKIDL